MAESKPDPISSDSLSGKNGGLLHNDHHHHHKETHGLREDIDETTSMSDVKAPNVFERAKEEIEALVETFHPKKEPKVPDSSSCTETRDHATKDHLQVEKSESHSDKNVKKQNFVEKAKEEIESLMHKPKHQKETHGTSDDINENTPINEVKGPNVFERAKEEIEALIQTIHPKKDSGVVSSEKKEGGFPVSIGRGLEKLCSPRGHNKD